MITATVDVLVVRECNETVSVELDENDLVEHFELENAEDITSVHVREWLEEDVWADIPSALTDIREVQTIYIEGVHI